MLYRDWLTQVFAFLIFGGIYFGIMMFGASAVMIVEELFENKYFSALCFSLYSVFSAVIMIPIFCGIVKFESRAIERESARLYDLFYAFEDIDALIRSYRVFFTAIFNCVLNFIPAAVIGWFLSDYYEEGIFGATASVYGQDGIYLVLNALLVFFVIVGFVLSSKSIVGIYVSLERPKENVSDCFFVAGLCISRSRREMAWLILSFAPLCVLSLFSLGFLFVMFTFPYMALSLTMFSKYLYEKEMHTKSTMSVLYPESCTSNGCNKQINEE